MKLRLFLLLLFAGAIAASQSAIACEPNSEPEERQVKCRCTGGPAEQVVCAGTIDSSWCTSAYDWEPCDANGECYLGNATAGCPSSKRPPVSDLILPDKIEVPGRAVSKCGISVEEWFAQRSFQKVSSRTTKNAAAREN